MSATPAWFDEVLGLSGRAYGLALRASGAPALAEEAVQEAVLRLLRHPPEPMGEPALRAYFLRTVHSAAVSLAESEAARGRREEVRAVESGNEIKGSGPFSSIAGREAALAAQAMLAELPREMRVAVSLCCEQGLTQKEAAEITGAPEGTVARRVQRGLEQLRERLTAAGYAAAGVAPAVLAGMLGSLGAPAAPEGLSSALARLVSGGAGPGSAPAATKSSAPPKGGLIVKIGPGIAAAGLAAGGIFWAVGGGAGDKGPEPAVAVSATTSPSAGELKRVPGVPVPGLGGNGYVLERVTGLPNQSIADQDGPSVQALHCGGIGGGTSDGEGNIVISTVGLRQVKLISLADGRTRVLAGCGRYGLRDDCPAIEAEIAWGLYFARGGLGCDHKGNYYILENNGRLRRIFKNEQGVWWIRHSAGVNESGLKPGAPAARFKSRGDELPAMQLRISELLGVSPDGDVYVACPANGAIARIRGEKAEAVFLLDETFVNQLKGDPVWKQVGAGPITGLPKFCSFDGRDRFLCLGPGTHGAGGGKNGGFYTLTLDGKITPLCSYRPNPKLAGKTLGLIDDGPPAAEVTFYCVTDGSCDPFEPGAYYACEADTYYLRKMTKDGVASLQTDGTWVPNGKKRWRVGKGASVDGRTGDYYMKAYQGSSDGTVLVRIRRGK